MKGPGNCPDAPCRHEEYGPATVYLFLRADQEENDNLLYKVQVVSEEVGSRLTQVFQAVVGEVLQDLGLTRQWCLASGFDAPDKVEETPLEMMLGYWQELHSLPLDVLKKHGIVGIEVVEEPLYVANRHDSVLESDVVSEGP